MTSTDDEIARREKAAITAIKSTFGATDGEYGVTLFVSHHIAELDSAYWEKHLGTKNPDPVRVLDIIELRSHWGENEDVDDDEGIEVFDFTLPGDVTNYVLSVRFDDAGKVEGVTMES